MSQNDNTEVTAVAEAPASRLESIIEDPMKSALAATAATALAVCVVLSGIWAISASVY
ncbi:MAG: hypothetical protein ACE37D_09915 [Pseudomonadales bacterium]